jgi:hypothetical protein
VRFLLQKARIDSEVWLTAPDNLKQNQKKITDESGSFETPQG